MKIHFTGIVTWVREKIDPNYKPPKAAVVALTQETFHSFIGDKDVVLVEFYAPWYHQNENIANANTLIGVDIVRNLNQSWKMPLVV
jgi:hypothetical protein